MDVQQLTRSESIVGNEVDVLSNETDGEFRRVLPGFDEPPLPSSQVTGDVVDT